jgi:hypothetical protein
MGARQGESASLDIANASSAHSLISRLSWERDGPCGLIYVSHVYLLASVVRIFRLAWTSSLCAAFANTASFVLAADASGRVDNEANYKARNVIDVPVYRASDAITAQVSTALEGGALRVTAVALLGAGVSVVWAVNGWWLGKKSDARES